MVGFDLADAGQHGPGDPGIGEDRVERCGELRIEKTATLRQRSAEASLIRTRGSGFLPSGPAANVPGSGPNANSQADDGLCR